MIEKNEFRQLVKNLDGVKFSSKEEFLGFICQQICKKFERENSSIDPFDYLIKKNVGLKLSQIWDELISDSSFRQQVYDNDE